MYTDTYLAVCCFPCDSIRLKNSMINFMRVNLKATALTRAHVWCFRVVAEATTAAPPDLSYFKTVEVNDG